MWVGFLIAAILIVLELAAGGLLGWAKVAGSSNPKVPSITGLVIAIWVIYVGGYVYWLWSIYRIHKILAEASNSTYPVTPRKAVGFQFIPIYNLVWNFNWPRRIAQFVNARTTGTRMNGIWFGVVLLLAWILGSIDQGLQILVLFGAGTYLVRKLHPIVDADVLPMAAAFSVPEAFPVAGAVAIPQSYARVSEVPALTVPREWVLPIKAGAGATFGFLLCYGFLWLTGQLALAPGHIGEEIGKLLVVALLLWFFVEPLFGLLSELLGFQEEQSPTEVRTVLRLIRFAIFICVVIGSHSILEETFAHSYDRVGLVVTAAGLTFLFVVLTYALIAATPQPRLSKAVLFAVGIPALAALGIVAVAVDYQNHPERLSPTQVITAAAGPSARLVTKATNPSEHEEEVGEIPLPSTKDISVLLIGAVLLACAGLLALRLHWGPKGVAGLVFLAAVLAAAIIFKYSLLSRIHLLPGLWAAFWWCVGILAFCEGDLLKASSSSGTLPGHHHGSPLRQDSVVRISSFVVLSLLIALFWIIPKGDVNLVLSSPDPKVRLGSPVTLMAIVAPSPTASGTDTPTGKISFHCEDCQGAELSAQETLSDGVAPHVVNLPVGIHTIGARYGGDLSFRGPDAEATTQVVVAPPPTATQVSVYSPDPNITVGFPVTLVASITPATSAVGPPTGKVVFRCNDCEGPEFPAEETVSNGTALHAANLSLGTHSITADYSGDDNFIASSTSQPWLQAIQSAGGGSGDNSHAGKTIHDSSPGSGPGSDPGSGPASGPDSGPGSVSQTDPIFAAPVGTAITARTIDVIDSTRNKTGQNIAASLAVPIMVNGRILARSGAPVTLTLTDVDPAGRFNGKPAVTFRLASIDVGGTSYRVTSTLIRREGQPRGAATAKKAGIGAAVGGALGGIFGRNKKDAAIGAGSGAALGAGSQAFTNAGSIRIPSETLFTFTVRAN